MDQNNFVKRVRNGELKSPTQSGFSLKSWERYYSSIGLPSLSEQRLHDSGVWFASKLGQVRELLDEFKGIGIPSDRTVQAHVGAANWMIRNDTRLHEEHIYTSPQDGTGEGETDSFLPGAYSVMQLHWLIEGFVTSLRFPFGTAVRESGRPVEVDIPEGVEAITKIRIRIQAGSIYDLLYYLWNECLWNDYYVDTSCEMDVVVPGNEQLAMVRAVGESRWTQVVMELFLGLDAVWRRRTLTERQHLVSMPRVQSLVEDAGRWRILTGPGDATLPNAPIELVTKGASTELYFGGLLDAELPNFPGLSINRLTSAWASLAPLADLVLNQFPEHGHIDTLGQILEYCPIFERSQLEEALSASMSITNDQAKLILELLTFSDVREELWLRPFVRVNEETVAMLVTALKAPNLLRSIEQWMNIGGLDMDRRGEAFERFVRDELFQRNKLADFQMVQEPFILEVEDTSEEIDLVARIGNTIMVGEVKCTILPTEPIEVHRYFNDRLSLGASQAARKAEFAKANFDAFVSEAGFTEIAEVDAEIIPIVLTNLTLGVGLPVDGVPIVDLLILGRFIDDGVVGHNVYFNDDGERVVEYEERLYASEAEAAANLKEYLRNPPQLRQYKAQLDALPVPITSVSEDDKPAYLMKLVSASPEITS